MTIFQRSSSFRRSTDDISLPDTNTNVTRVNSSDASLGKIAGGAPIVPSVRMTKANSPFLITFAMGLTTPLFEIYVQYFWGIMR